MRRGKGRTCEREKGESSFVGPSNAAIVTYAEIGSCL